MGNGTQQQLGHRSSGSRTNSWDKAPVKAIVYDPTSRRLSTDYLSTLESQSDDSNAHSQLTRKTESDNFQVHLPWWRNSVDIYVDAEARSGFVATVRLDKLGLKKNWQRRLRQNYTVLRVKGPKPNGNEETMSFNSAEVTS